MNDILQANVFFFITSVAVVAVTIMWIVILWYVIGILREMRKVARKVSRASEGLERDLELIRTEVRNNIDKVSGLFSTIGGFFLGALSRPKKSQSTRKRSSTETKGKDSV